MFLYYTRTYRPRSAAQSICKLLTVEELQNAVILKEKYKFKRIPVKDKYIFGGSKKIIPKITLYFKYMLPEILQIPFKASKLNLLGKIVNTFCFSMKTIIRQNILNMVQSLITKTRVQLLLVWNILLTLSPKN